jgi:hypothetical protein
MIEEISLPAMFAIRVLIRLKSRIRLESCAFPGHQSACAGDRASAEVISNTTAATHDSVGPFQTECSQRLSGKADLHGDVGSKLL